jgi:DNA-directed RNA polymerase subunit M/transcription elongation factor TFIIS
MLRLQLATLASIATKRPSCPKCGTMMDIARNEPHSSEYRRRIYDCRECDHSESSLMRLT